MRTAVLLTLLAAVSSQQVKHRIAKPVSSLAVGSVSNGTSTSISSFRNMALDLELATFVLKGRDPRFPKGGGEVTTGFTTRVAGHDASTTQVNNEWPHPTGTPTGNENPARILTGSNFVTYPRGECFGSTLNSTTGSNVATVCDFSYAVTMCKQPVCTTQAEISVYQGLEMTSRSLPSEVEILTASGRDKHCVFGVSSARGAAPSQTDEGVTAWDPSGVLTDFTGTCENSTHAGRGSMLNVVKVHKLRDDGARLHISRWLRLQWTISGSDGMPNFSFKNSSGLWEEGWPGVEEIQGFRFCNYNSTVKPDFLECVMHEFADNFVRGTAANGDASTAALNTNNPTRTYYFAQQGSTVSQGTLIADVRLDVGQYVLLPSFVTYSGRRN